MVVHNEHCVNIVGETRSINSVNGLIMIADSPPSVTVIDVENDHELTYKNTKVSLKNGSDTVAQAILICRPNSHPFQERKLPIDQPVKIGRSVARARPATNNAIFDCKVLSRNHALLFYESGKFYLQDTKSSNGTFVNNQRLSKGSEESAAREVCSGDIVQFGVDVMENSRKVTHGCIVATLKLILPDGKEAKASPTTSVSSSLVGTQELYQLSQCLQEAVHREQLLETKLATLQRIIHQIKESSDTSWKALIEEDRVLTRLELLENQAQTFSKNFSEDKVREEITKLQNEKDSYQKSAKESLRKVLQEKLEAVRKHQELESSLNNAEEECTHLQKVSDGTKKELDLLAEKNNTLLKEITELSLKIDAVDTANKEKMDELEQSEQDRQQLELKIEELAKNETAMTARLECLQHDNDISKEQISALRTLADANKKDTKEQNEINEYKTFTKAIQVGMIIDKIEEEENSDGFLKEAEQELEEMRRQVSNSESELEESKNKVWELQEHLEILQRKSKQSMNTVAILEAQLDKYKCQGETNNQLTEQLQVQISQLEEELIRVQDDKAKSEDKSKMIICDKTFTNESIQTNGGIHLDESNHESVLEAEIIKLKELLAETRSNKQTAEEELIKYKSELDGVHKSAKNSAEETNTLKQQLILTEQETEAKAKNVTRLQEQLSRAEQSVKEIKQQISGLKSRLAIEEESAKSKQKQIDRLLAKLEDENAALQKSNASLNELNIQLQDAQQSAKQSHNEAELLRGKVKSLQEELMKEGSNKQANNNKVFEQNTCLKEECSNLKSKLSEIEDEVFRSKAENKKLLMDCKKLQENNTKMEIIKERMGKLGPGFLKDEVEKIRKEYELCQSQLEETREEVIKIKGMFYKCQDEKIECQRDLKSLKNIVSSLSYQTDMVSLCAIIPIVILIIASILAILPTWSSITATQDKASPS